MPPAVRVSDPTNHGGVVTGPGAANVMIGGMPAAVAGDMHTCAIVAPGHLPVSAFPMGSATVMIGGRPALRTSDACLCGAMAAVGSPTVNIN